MFPTQNLGASLGNWKRYFDGSYKEPLLSTEQSVFLKLGVAKACPD